MSRSGLYIKQLAGYKAFIPKPLPPEPEIKLSEELAQKLILANSMLYKLDGLGYTLPNTGLFISMYVKKEALLSSQIEGSQASLEEIFEFEGGGATSENINDIEEVVNYIKAMNFGLDRLQQFPMSLRLIKEIHAILLNNVRGNNKTPGEFKKSQNWIGPANSTLKDALFVPPPADEALKAMADLEKYMYDDVKTGMTLINCALIHYQFETIHHFLDGNGRVGRLLITLYLCWKGVVEKPLLYISYFFKKNRQEYYDRLMLVRTKGDFEQWINFFLDAIINTSESAINDTKKILKLHAEDQQKLLDARASSAIAIGVLNHLFYKPIVSVADIQKEFNVSHPTATAIINLMTKLNILKEITGKKRSKKFIYKRYMDILSEGTL